MYLTQNNFLGHHFTSFFASLRMTVLNFVKSESMRPKAASTQTQTITLRSMSSRMERSEMRDLVDSSAKL